jgi:hypothetical protein
LAGSLPFAPSPDAAFWGSLPPSGFSALGSSALLSSNAVNVPIAIFEKHLQAGLLWLLFLESELLAVSS